jgi:hypothetical protein
MSQMPSSITPGELNNIHYNTGCMKTDENQPQPTYSDFYMIANGKTEAETLTAHDQEVFQQWEQAENEIKNSF